jgi:hypothetical protein
LAPSVGARRSHWTLRHHQTRRLRHHQTLHHRHHQTRCRRHRLRAHCLCHGLMAQNVNPFAAATGPQEAILLCLLQRTLLSSWPNPSPSQKVVTTQEQETR